MDQLIDEMFIATIVIEIRGRRLAPHGATGLGGLGGLYYSFLPSTSFTGGYSKFVEICYETSMFFMEK